MSLIKIAAQRLVDKFCDKGIQVNYNSGIDKIKAVMRIAQKEAVINIDTKIGTLDFSAPALNADVEQSWLQMIMDAIVKNKKINLTYQSVSSDASSTRLVDCVGVFFSMANWYIIGYCNLKNDYRTFRLSRIQGIKLTEMDANIKHPPLQSFLESLGECQSLQKVVLEVDKAKLNMIDSQKYFQGLIEEKIVGEKVELCFMTYSIDRFARWYLSFADIAKVITPIELKLRVQEIVKNTC